MLKKGIKRVKKEIIILAVIGLVYLLALNSNLSAGGDDTHYMILARAILSGQGYTDIQLPIPSAHSTYPPFFPLFLSPFDDLAFFHRRPPKQFLFFGFQPLRTFL